MEYLYGLLSSISRDLVSGVVNQLRYPCCFNTFVEELAKEEHSLITRRKDVKDRIADAKKQTRKTAQVVDKWVEDADTNEGDVKKLLEKARTKQSCCFGHCPNWIWRYNLGKKLANKKTELENFIKEGGQYIQLERVATLPSSTFDNSSEKYLSLGSRQKANEELMEAVKDDEVSMIGLYGMGGCGKTTMAMEVQKKAEAEHLFDEVLFVPVSSTVEVRRIQDKIASSLQYTFPENEERERAKRLYMRLSQENKILVILDDVWEKLDFGAIGIPSAEHHKGCKVLITTRSEDVCTSNDCQKKIQLQILTNEEAWALFQTQARVSESTSDTLKCLARHISDECKGLPVAIAAVASTLKGKDEVIWKVALNKLRSCKPINIEKGLQDPYKCLELSYHYLDTEEAKSLFLLCSVFPEDYEIPIELLARCAIGLGVVGEVCSYDEARSEVIAAKIKLMSSCLLLDASDDKDECVKMHDLVRDVAHLIAKNGIKCAVENDVTLVTLEQNSVRYLWCEKLPNDLDCSNLEFLYVTTGVEVLDESFTRMGKLKVLCLFNEDGLPLSTMSFKTLTNLRCLILSRWKLSDISFVRYMKKLESLSLNECSLPSFLDLQKDDAVTQLTKLKLLVLRQCEMERNSFEMIGRIPQLEELCIVDESDIWDDYGENTIEFYKTFSVPQTLQWYTILFGYRKDYCGRLEYFLTRLERTLMLPCFVISNEAIKGLAKKAKTLYMANIEGDAKNIIPNIFQLEGGGMPELNYLRISDSKEIECLVDSSNHTSEVVGSLFSNLVELDIDGMADLRVLWHGCLPPNGTFTKLESLELWNCPKLISLLTQAITPNPVRYTIFQNLQKVDIHRCEKLKYVFSANTVGGLPQLETLKICCCDKVEQIVEDIIPPVANELEIIEENTSTPSTPLVNHSPEPCFPKLKQVFVEECHKLKRLFSISASNDLSNLEELTISGADKLEELIVFELRASNNFQFQHLKTLRITGCAKLEVIFPVFVVRCLPELEHLEIRECKELKHIMEEDENDRIQRELKPRFPKLKVVAVGQCHKLKCLFSTPACNNLPNLEFLIINGADELDELIGCEQGEDEEIGRAKVKLPKLKILIFMHLSNLCQGIELRAIKHCIIDNCPKLSLTSTTTLQELCDNFSDSEFDNIGLPQWEFRRLIDEINKSNEVSENSSTGEFPSPQVDEELENEFTDGSEVHATATSTNSELNGRPSLSPLDVLQHETYSQNIKIGVEEGTVSENAMMVSSHLESTSSQMSHKSYAREWDSKPENTSPLQMNQEDPSTSKSKSPSSQVNDRGQSILGSIAETELEIQVLSNADGSDNHESLVKTSLDSTAEVISLLKSPTIPVSATDVEIVEPSIDDQASKANLSMSEDIGESHPSEEVVEETATKQDPKNDESETSTNPLANPLATYITPDDSDDEFEEDFKSFDILTEWEQGLIQRAECETFRTSFREKAFNVDILTIVSDENLKVEVQDAAAKLLSFGGLVPEKERVRIQMFLDLLDEVVSKVKLQKNQQIQIENIKNTSLDQRNQIEFVKQQANTSKLSFKENKSELVKLDASEKVFIEKIAALQLKLSSVQIEKQTLESRQNDLRQTIKSSAAHAKSVSEQLKAQLEKISQLETSQVELAESLESLKKKQKTQGQNYFM